MSFDDEPWSTVSTRRRRDDRVSPASLDEGLDDAWSDTDSFELIDPAFSYEDHLSYCRGSASRLLKICARQRALRGC